MPPNHGLWMSASGIILGSLATLGCGSEPPLATVSGTVVCPENRPLAGLLVTFLPDPDRQTGGLHASGVTDEAGRFSLVYRDTPTRVGAAVGWHRVVIEDFAAENHRDSPRQRVPRVPSRYRLASTTPLNVQIQPGQQTIRLQIEN